MDSEPEEELMGLTIKRGPHRPTVTAHRPSECGEQPKSPPAVGNGDACDLELLDRLLPIPTAEQRKTDREYKLLVGPQTDAEERAAARILERRMALCRQARRPVRRQKRKQN